MIQMKGVCHILQWPNKAGQKSYLHNYNWPKRGWNYQIEHVAWLCVILGSGEWLMSRFQVGLVIKNIFLIVMGCPHCCQTASKILSGMPCTERHAKGWPSLSSLRCGRWLSPMAMVVLGCLTYNVVLTIGYLQKKPTNSVMSQAGLYL